MYTDHAVNTRLSSSRNISAGLVCAIHLPPLTLFNLTDFINYPVPHKAWDYLLLYPLSLLFTHKRKEQLWP